MKLFVKFFSSTINRKISFRVAQWRLFHLDKPTTNKCKWVKVETIFLKNYSQILEQIELKAEKPRNFKSEIGNNKEKLPSKNRSFAENSWTHLTIYSRFDPDLLPNFSTWIHFPLAIFFHIISVSIHCLFLVITPSSSLP